MSDATTLDHANPHTVAVHSTMYCTFRIDDLYLGIDAGVVQEVLREQPITPVPLAAPEVRGLINLRGQIVTAIDLGMKDPEKDFHYPGISVLRKGADGAITRVARDFFGPGDDYCLMWSIMALFPEGQNDWWPKFDYE